MPVVRVVKAHAYGNDFVCAPAADAGTDLPSLARAICHRHHGIGADGLLLYTLRDRGASMKLAQCRWQLVRALGERLAMPGGSRRAHPEPDAGSDGDDRHRRRASSRSSCSRVMRERYTFRAAMGQPANLRQTTIAVLGESGDGHPSSKSATRSASCSVRLPDADRFNRLGPALATHPMFPAGTNVEFAEVESAGSRADPDLGARCRPHHLFGNRLVGVGRRRSRPWRRLAIGRRRRTRRHPARRVARGWCAPHWLGGGDPRGLLDGHALIQGVASGSAGPCRTAFPVPSFPTLARGLRRAAPREGASSIALDPLLDPHQQALRLHVLLRLERCVRFLQVPFQLLQPLLRGAACAARDLRRSRTVHTRARLSR